MKSGGVHDHDSINIKLVEFWESLYTTANRNNVLPRLEFEEVTNTTHCCFGKHLNAPASNQSCSCWFCPFHIYLVHQKKDFPQTMPSLCCQRTTHLCLTTIAMVIGVMVGGGRASL